MKRLFLLIGLLLAPLTWSLSDNLVKPLTINIANDEEAQITLSNQDINRLFVINDKITSLNAPNNRLTAHNDQSGSLFMNIAGESSFTAFITTQAGRQFSLLITPQKKPGVTVRLMPTTPRLSQNHTVATKQFNLSAAYEKILINLLKNVMRGKTPAGFSTIAPSEFNHIALLQAPKYFHEKHFLPQKVVSGFVGKSLAIRVLALTNQSRTAIPLKTKDFYFPGIKAISLNKKLLMPHETTYVVEVSSYA